MSTQAEPQTCGVCFYFGRAGVCPLHDGVTAPTRSHAACDQWLPAGATAGKHSGMTCATCNSWASEDRKQGLCLNLANAYLAADCIAKQNPQTAARDHCARWAVWARPAEPEETPCLGKVHVRIDAAQAAAVVRQAREETEAAMQEVIAGAAARLQQLLYLAAGHDLPKPHALRCPEENGGCGGELWQVALDRENERVILDCLTVCEALGSHYRISLPLDLARLSETGPLDETGPEVRP